MGYVHLRKGLVCHQLLVSNILHENVKCKNVKYKNVKSKVMVTEAHLKPSQTSVMELFSEKCLLADVWLGSNYVSGPLDAPCKIMPLNIFILYFYVITSLYFVRIWQE